MTNQPISIKTKNEQSIYARRLQALRFAGKYPKKVRELVSTNVSEIYEYGIRRNENLPTLPVDKVLHSGKQISLFNPVTRNGNVSYLELLVIANIVAVSKPKNILEIGTFDGNTTVQLALNSPPNALVNTIDLPHSDPHTTTAILTDDLVFVHDEEKKHRKYISSPCEEKVIQHFGDSTSYDFSLFCKSGSLDFCFIDGGHSYDCVKKDTENTRNFLSKDAVILWHDYTPNCPGVFTYLNELGKTAHIYHIEGTNLAVLFQGNVECALSCG